MSQDDPKNLEPGGTIQVDGDALKQVQLTDLPPQPLPAASRPPGSRKTPPPLPPSASVIPAQPVLPAAPSVPVDNEPPKKPLTAKTIVLFVVVAAVFAVVGVTLGNWARSRNAPPPASAASPLVLPPVEMQSPESPSAAPSSP